MDGGNFKTQARVGTGEMEVRGVFCQKAVQIQRVLQPTTSTSAYIFSLALTKAAKSQITGIFIFSNVHRDTKLDCWSYRDQ